MASPIWNGTPVSTALTSSNIDIVKEAIHLTLDKELNTGYYVVEYVIKTDTNGKQIPLLFYARDYNSKIKIRVDGKETALLRVPYEIKHPKHTEFEKFEQQFDTSYAYPEIGQVSICWYESNCYNYSINDLKYFEADLSKGLHTIRVEYEAEAATNKTDWVKEISFRYSLSPAKYWRSFGTLEITLDNRKSKIPLQSNLPAPNSGSTDSIAVWKFNHIPKNFFYFSYKPPLNFFAKVLIAIGGPFALTGLFAAVLFYLHFIFIKRFRLKNPGKKVGAVLLIGTLINTFLILASPTFFCLAVDAVIGPYASNFHGYVFLTIIFYPVAAPAYWIVMWFSYKIFIE